MRVIKQSFFTHIFGTSPQIPTRAAPKKSGYTRGRMTVPTAALRDAIRRLLDPDSPSDALASYYALYHDPGRTEIFVYPENSARPEGFLVRARTGHDLFRPLVTFRALEEAAALDLFRRGLPAFQPVYFAIPEALAGPIHKHLQVTDAAMMLIMALDSRQYEPIINVLVTVERSPDGLARYEIRSGDKVQAAAGLNWRSSEFGELYVYTEAAVRGRGWGKSVASALAGDLLRMGVRPLYVVEESNTASIRLAESIGFRDTGFREYAGQAILSSNAEHLPRTQVPW